ncbi:MAG TPA: HisA/HisF-related TIM barrel protein [Planctomycetaceae bacterium]|nr:HisA/HisF-related TIM barrel protein [Planctomycetaceae bacterium]
MQIIPVIDIRNGIAVRAVAGERDRYQAIQSCLTPSAEPAEVLRALDAAFHCSSCYVADLDAIERQQINRCTIAEISRVGVSLIVDAGTVTCEQIDDLLDLGVKQVVLSSESVANLSELDSLVRGFDPSSLIFSIDLKHGQLLAKDIAWQDKAPLELAGMVLGLGLSQIIVLDLAAVGTGHGIPTLPLCRQIRQLSDSATIISGGGVQSRDCLTQASDAGLDGLLIASALHDGRLTAEDLMEWLNYTSRGQE